MGRKRELKELLKIMDQEDPEVELTGAKDSVKKLLPRMVLLLTYQKIVLGINIIILVFSLLALGASAWLHSLSWYTIGASGFCVLVNGQSIQNYRGVIWRKRKAFEWVKDIVQDKTMSVGTKQVNLIRFTFSQDIEEYL